MPPAQPPKLSQVFLSPRLGEAHGLTRKKGYRKQTCPQHPDTFPQSQIIPPPQQHSCFTTRAAHLQLQTQNSHISSPKSTIATQQKEPSRKRDGIKKSPQGNKNKCRTSRAEIPDNKRVPGKPIPLTGREAETPRPHHLPWQNNSRLPPSSWRPSQPWACLNSGQNGLILICTGWDWNSCLSRVTAAPECPGRGGKEGPKPQGKWQFMRKETPTKPRNKDTAKFKGFHDSRTHPKSQCFRPPHKEYFQDSEFLVGLKSGV